MHHRLPIKIVIFQLRLVLFVPIIAILILIIIQSVVFKVLPMGCLVYMIGRLDVVSQVIISTTNRVIAILIEKVAKRVIIALVLQYVKAILIVLATFNCFDLCLTKLYTEDAPAILIKREGSSDFLGRNVDTSCIVKASNRIHATLVIVKAHRVVETTFVKDVKAIIIVVTW